MMLTSSEKGTVLITHLGATELFRETLSSRPTFLYGMETMTANLQKSAKLKSKVYAHA